MYTYIRVYMNTYMIWIYIYIVISLVTYIAAEMKVALTRLHVMGCGQS